MPLETGTQLGPYLVDAAIGAGGMGEVYRATDTNLKRAVAIKVLPEALTGDVERLARLQREAEVLASLNHPNIASIYGLERTNGSTALVMELVEGPTLADRIAEGRVPVEEALAIGKQIAEALEAAHERGVVHRDLKPANVKVREDGTVKVLDFGLAKAIQPAGAPSSSSASMSPTITSPAMTQQGIILGTAAYMAPEQARGRAVDRRADIWAFGCVLYEMVTGRRAFSGEDVTETLAAVVMKEPDLQVAPAELRPLLAQCFQKDPRKRLRDISGLQYLYELGRAQAWPRAESERRRPLVPWLVAAALAATTAVALWAPWRAAPAVDRPLVRLSVDLGPEAEEAPGISVVVSPDGSRIVFVARAAGSGTTQLYTRLLDQKDATALPGTDSVFHQPFFSPDGEWIGFRSADGKFKKVAVQGGSAVTVGSWPGSANSGASWGDDGHIVFGSWTGLWSIPEGGGTARQLTKGDDLFPDVLPGSRAVLFGHDAGTVTTTLDDLSIDVVQVDTGKTKTLIDKGYWPRYLPTSKETGHLVYLSGSTLFGVGFDPRTLAVLGTPVPLLDDVAANPDYSVGGGQLAVSREGTVVYLSGIARNVPRALVWLAPDGRTAPLTTDPGVYGAPRISPDGKRLAYVAQGSGGFDVWVRDLTRGTATQLTFLAHTNYELAWARDSEHLVYGDGKAMWWIRVDGAEPARQLVGNLNGPRPFSFSPVVDGVTRLAFSPTGHGLPDVMTLPVDVRDPDHPKAGAVEPFLNEAALVEVDPAFSPDGKFLAYSANVGSTTEQVYVRSFPGPGGLWKVSTAGGKAPAWSPATRELLFLGGDNRIMAASYAIRGDSFSSGTPHAWSPTEVFRNGVQASFDVTPDGTRVVTLPRPDREERAGSLHATFLLNFFDELRRRVRPVRQ